MKWLTDLIYNFIGKEKSEYKPTVQDEEMYHDLNRTLRRLQLVESQYELLRGNEKPIQQPHGA